MSERTLKKRKVNSLPLVLTILILEEIVFEISKYIDKIRDYLNFAQINKECYNFFTTKYLTSLNELFKRNKIQYKPTFKPTYLNSVNTLKIENIDRYVLHNFKHLSSLQIIRSKIKDNDLKDFNNLTELSIKKCNEFNGFCFLNLKKLQKVKIKYCQLNSGHLLHLKNVQKLTLIECNSIIGNCLQKLQQLTSLKIVETHLNVVCLNTLTNLKKLHLFYSDKISNYNFLNNLINLQTLKTNGDTLKDKNLKNLKNLTYLKLYNHSKYIIGECFNSLNNLEYFYCKKTLSKLKENNIKHLPKLKALHLDGYNCENLQYLNQLYDLKINSSFNIYGEYLMELNYLTNLNLSFTNIEDQYLYHLNRLKTLNLSHCNKIDGDCLLELCNLTELNIENTNITENYLVNLIKIKKLNINECRKVVFGQFLLQMNHLQSLQIYNNTYTNEKTLSQMKYFLNQGNILYLSLYKQDSLLRENKMTLEEEVNNDDEDSLTFEETEYVDENDFLIKEMNNHLIEKKKEWKERLEEKEQEIENLKSVIKQLQNK
ncbi:hypothetical protein ABK040_002071 [Willaertia magna]